MQETLAIHHSDGVVDLGERFSDLVRKGDILSAHSRPPEKPVQVSQGFGDTEVVHFTKLSFLLQYHRGIPAEDHSDTSLGSYQCDRKPLPASGAGGCFPVGPDHIQVQAGTTLICGWLPASLGDFKRLGGLSCEAT
ncbi:3-isopropylmalate dehydratase small subunit [Frankliniella fusca]|uniref:3-isopropylmalate dehydratase small subunit n=1 Tax=Frankliniella fusca TaxID=407009 RepID=A0AAE1LHJ0_9NEOP|nr:3-isopropylmalate dehydratase small subunit [Frankliniella fusca]